MLMAEQMLLTIFIVAVAFRAEPKFQLGIGLIRPAADGAFMLCHRRTPVHLPLVLVLPLHLLRAADNPVSRSEEEYNKIKQRRQYGNTQEIVEINGDKTHQA